MRRLQIEKFHWRTDGMIADANDRVSADPSIFRSSAQSLKEECHFQ